MVEMFLMRVYAAAGDSPGNMPGLQTDLRIHGRIMLYPRMRRDRQNRSSTDGRQKKVDLSEFTQFFNTPTLSSIALCIVAFCAYWHGSWRYDK
jgi:hypothetical protein